MKTGIFTSLFVKKIANKASKAKKVVVSSNEIVTLSLYDLLMAYAPYALFLFSKTNSFKFSPELMDGFMAIKLKGYYFISDTKMPGH